MEENRRSRYRFNCRLPVEFTCDGKAYSGVTSNMSLGGMLIECPTLLNIGQRVMLKFGVPTQREFVEVGAEVRWVEKGKSLGVQFEGLRARDMWAINKFFEKHASKEP